MGLIDRIKSLVTTTKAEGDVTTGPWVLPISGGWIPAGSPSNWWQMGQDLQPLTGTSAIVEACISAYAQTLAMCPGAHKLLNPDNSIERITTSSLSRVLKRPNGYQTGSDFMVNAIRQLLGEGNAYALALRNSRFEITELHLMHSRSSAPMVAPSTGDIFYSLGGNSVVDGIFGSAGGLPMVPARDVLHLRINTHPYDPLRGISPIVAAALDIAATNAILRQQLDFYLNQARPSSALATDLVLEKEQVDQVRDLWNEQVRNLANGGWPILTGGLKPVSLSVTSEDAQLADVAKMSEQHIALAFRVPLQILGIGGTQGATESLMQSWLNQSLGFMISHIEEAYDKTFGLYGYPEEFTELDTSALLRMNDKDRIEGLVRGVQGGVISPDEARAKEGYGKVKGGFGEEPRVQQQVVPLSAAAAIPAAPTSPAAPAAPPAEAPTAKDFSNVPVTPADLRRFANDIERARHQSVP